MRINKKIMLSVVGVALSMMVVAQQNVADYVKKMVEEPDFESATIGISIYNATTGENIYSYNENKSLIPASIQKLLTTSAGFEELGANFRFRTSIGYVGELDKKGVLQGDVVIVGGGDPILGSYRYKQTAIDSVFAKWCEILSVMGVKVIGGHLSFDASIYDDRPLHDSWMWGDIGNYYGCGVHGLNIHENMYFAHFDAGTAINQKATLVNVTPKDINLISEVNVKTGEAGSGDRVVIYGPPIDNVRLCTGTVPLGKKNFKIRGSLPNPPKTCAELFAKYLNKNGIAVANDVIETSKNGRDITMVFDYYSPSYAEIVAYANQTSNNIYVESIYKYLGYKKYKIGTFETGSQAINDYLRLHNLSTKGIRIVDGSGLSRMNMMTARFMTDFLTEVSKQPYYTDYLGTLSQIGKSGTAKNMLKNTNLKRDIYIKSGSMNGIKSYAGYIVGNNGDVITFCFMVNNFKCSGTKVGKKLEQILLMLID